MVNNEVAKGSSISSVNDEIEVGYDSAFSDKWWKFNVACWYGLTFTLLAALAGALGRGPAAKAERMSADTAIRVQFDRLVRFRTPAEITVELRKPQEDRVTLRVSDVFRGKFKIQQVTPRPIAELSARDGTLFTFHSAAGSPLRVGLHFEPDSVGVARGEVQLLGGPPIQFSSVVLP